MQNIFKPQNSIRGFFSCGADTILNSRLINVNHVCKKSHLYVSSVVYANLLVDKNLLLDDNKFLYSVYLLTHIESQKMYVGSSENLCLQDVLNIIILMLI